MDLFFSQALLVQLVPSPLPPPHVQQTKFADQLGSPETVLQVKRNVS